MQRRHLLLSSALPLLAQAQTAKPSEILSMTLQGGPGPAREMPLLVWNPSGTAHGQLLFSHGLGGRPQAYTRLMEALQGAGYRVVAPLHVDSTEHPQSKGLSLQQSFFLRLRELGAAAGLLAQQSPQLPLGCVGHSYGSLFSWCLGGGLAELGPLRQPTVRAVLAFSSPGVLPMMQRARSLRSLAVPNLTVSGDADRVPGFVIDPADHRLAFEQAQAPSYLLWLAQGGHELVNDAPSMQRVLPPVLDFLAAHVLGKADAASRLAAFEATQELSLSTRNV
jgi:alpha-beta hydrolase superfamily lysophospholipase